MGWSRCLWLGLALTALLCRPAVAHEGPPYPLLVDQKAGPYLFSVWADPDVGVGTFHFTFEAAAPETIELYVQPDDRRTPELRSTARRQRGERPVRFTGEADFATEEWWRVRFVMNGALGMGETATRVMVTPPGFGRWDLLLYGAPFLAVGFLWFKAVLRTRNVPKPK